MTREMAKGRHVAASGDRHYTRTNPELVVRGEQKPASKLTDKTIREARQRRREGVSVRELAADAGVHPYTLRKALDGTAWSHVTDEVRQ